MFDVNDNNVFIGNSCPERVPEVEAMVIVTECHSGISRYVINCNIPIILMDINVADNELYVFYYYFSEVDIIQKIRPPLTIGTPFSTIMRDHGIL